MKKKPTIIIETSEDLSDKKIAFEWINSGGEVLVKYMKFTAFQFLLCHLMTEMFSQDSRYN